jgi:cobalamin biosynthetic protein CobC
MTGPTDMTGLDLPAHGGDLALATRLYGQPEGGWLDLSTGINPWPWPIPTGLLSSEVFHRLPDRAALADLEAQARSAYQVPAGAAVIAVSGTESAVHLLPRLAPPNTAVFVLAPIYSSHRSAWPHAVSVATPDAVPDDSIVILANPNNPDGRVLSPDALRALAKRARWLIVDEAFADVAPDVSLVPALPDNGVVLRSFGKFYGLAGVRLGFVIATEATAMRVSALLGGWAVSGPAIAIGTTALADTAWRDAMRHSLRDEAAALRALLVRHGLRIVGGTDLFVLVEADDAHALHRALARRGIWTRIFVDQPSRLRFGLPGSGHQRLERALTELRPAPRG